VGGGGGSNPDTKRERRRDSEKTAGGVRRRLPLISARLSGLTYRQIQEREGEKGKTCERKRESGSPELCVLNDLYSLGRGGRWPRRNSEVLHLAARGDQYKRGRVTGQVSFIPILKLHLDQVKGKKSSGGEGRKSPA